MFVNELFLRNLYENSIYLSNFPLKYSFHLFIHSFIHSFIIILLGKFGLTINELERYKTAILSEAMQQSASSEQLNHEIILQEIMESDACGHTYMSSQTKLKYTEKLINEITLNEINEIAKELCEHLSEFNTYLFNDSNTPIDTRVNTQTDTYNHIKPNAIITCKPIKDRNNNNFIITENDINSIIINALNESIEPLIETIVPQTLISNENLYQKSLIYQSKWINFNEINDNNIKNNEKMILNEKINEKNNEKINNNIFFNFNKNFNENFNEKINEKKINEILILNKNLLNNYNENIKLQNQLNIRQKQLTNGIKVNMKSLIDEPQRANIRIYVPGALCVM